MNKTADFTSELDRLRKEYARRAAEIPEEFYSASKPANLFMLQQRTRAKLIALRRYGCLPLAGKRILEVGCGTGALLVDFEQWGASRECLAGIDLEPERVAAAQRCLCEQRDERGRVLAQGADIRLGDASALPWPDGFFDIVLQSTVFTSVLDDGMKHAIAAEMVRVLKLGGIALWYDFFYNNPRNPNVKKVSAAEIRSLFPGCDIRLTRITLAPPIARRLVPISWVGALLLEKLRVLNTHYLGVLRKPAK